MVIREVKRSDLLAVTELLQGLSAFIPQEFELENSWLGFISQANLLAIVAEIDGVVVGYGVLLTEEKIRGGKAGHIEDIVTHPDYRGIGIGRAITDFWLAGRLIWAATSWSFSARKRIEGFTSVWDTGRCT